MGFGVTLRVLNISKGSDIARRLGSDVEDIPDVTCRSESYTV